MSSIDNTSINEFISLFNRDLTNYLLPLYDNTHAYFVGDVVYYLNNFYKSLIDDNTSLPTDATTWKLTKDSILNYITESDIERAFNEAKVNFNPTLFDDDETALLTFYYLAAHYLVIDITNALNPMSAGFTGLTQSKSVGSISESYAIPQWVLNNKLLGSYAQTGYGRRYLSLILFYITGNIIVTEGDINLG